MLHGSGLISIHNLIVLLQMVTRRQEHLVDLKQKENSNKCSC